MARRLHHYDHEWRLECSLQLLEEIEIPPGGPGRANSRAHAEAAVRRLVPRSFIEDCPRFHNMHRDDVLRYAITDVAQFLFEQGILYFDNFLEISESQLHQMAYNRGFMTGRRKQVEEALMDENRAAVRRETRRLCDLIEERILDALEEELRDVVGVAFRNFLHPIPGSTGQQ